jgi:hypothetical protein
MYNISLGFILIIVSIAFIPLILGLVLLAYLWEKLHGGEPIRLTRGMDFKKLGMLA